MAMLLEARPTPNAPGGATRCRAGTSGLLLASRLIDEDEPDEIEAEIRAREEDVKWVRRRGRIRQAADE
jgi:hypothetical protein